MKMRISLALAGAVLAGWGAYAAPETNKAIDTAKTSSDVADFVHLSTARPVFVRLHILLDGKPYQRAWSEFMDHLFTRLDTDKDGFLSKDELARVPAPGTLFSVGGGFGGDPQMSFAAVDADGDGKVSLEELKAFFRKNTGGPFRFQITQDQRDAAEMVFGRGEAARTADEMTAGLIALLDTNKDGKLSKEELAAAPEVLRRLDIDDDEIVTLAEFTATLPRRSRGVYAAPVATASSPTGPKEAPPQAFYEVTAGANAVLAKQLLSRYAPKGAKTLSRKDSGLDEATFNQLDVDGNGELDSEELARFAQRPADLELTVRLGKLAGAEPRLALAEIKGKPAVLAAKTRQAKDSLVLDLNASQMEIEGKAEGANAKNNVEYIRQLYENQFDAADRDGNGYLDEKEAKQSGFFRNSFKAMDLDGDGKLFKKEMLEYLDRFIDLQASALASQATVSVSEASRGLFDLIDTNRDGRLSVRELRNAVNLLERLDRNNDGFLSANEIPRTYQVVISQGPPDNGQGFAVRFDPTQLYKPLPETAVGPLWFRKMDLNRDGDLSRREFIGTKEEFDRIDTDHDGLISVEEAEKYDALRRKAKH